MRAEDVLPDNVDQREFDGVVVRKGSVGAFLVNAKILADLASSAAVRAEAERDILAVLPALRALGLFDVFELRDEKLRALVEAH
jgi:hypothetical protein